MPSARWISLVEDDLRAANYGTIIDRAKAAATGNVDPIADPIANVTAEIRSAVRAGNTLDADDTKIPRSLKRLAVRLIVWGLMDLIGVELDKDQENQKESDDAKLKQLFARKEQVEPADDPDTSAVGAPVNPGTWNSENKIIPRGHPVPRPGLQQGSAPGQYANPNAPTDNGV